MEDALLWKNVSPSRASGQLVIPTWNFISDMKTANDPMYIEFIARLRSARKSMNFTQKDLAAALNQPQSYVSKVETCERRIDVVEAARWCFALGVKIEDVLPTQLRPRS